jgi:hypothetical protein
VPHKDRTHNGGVDPETERDDEQGHDRRLYDVTNAWGGRHPLDLTTVVVTHQRPDDRPQDDENFVFVTTGIEDAVARAREITGGKDVGVRSAEGSGLWCRDVVY